MFDVSFTELVVIAIVGLLVIGPDRLPEALRTLGLWIGRLRRSFTNVKAEIEKEIGMDEIRRQLHNEAVMEEMRRIERDVRESVDSSSSAHGERSAPPHTEPATVAPASGEGDGQPPADDAQPIVASPAEPAAASDRAPAAASDPAPAPAPSPEDRSGADPGEGPRRG